MSNSPEQALLASLLGTTTSGTAWSTGNGYPVPNVLNSYQSINDYVPEAMPASPGSSDISGYESDLMFDISGVGAPVIGDAWEVPNHPHLVGHPLGDQIFHWFDVRGYTNGGANTMYEDSVHGFTDVSSSGIPWAAGVPAYSTMPSSTIAGILGGRGYVW
jgi:hypothetical protein